MQKSKITQFMETGTSTWKDKTLTKFSVKMENGDSGIYTTGFNDNDKLPELGLELEYELQDKGYGNEIKPKMEAKSGGGFKGGFQPNPKKEALITATAMTMKFVEMGGDKTEAKMIFIEWYKLAMTLQTDDKLETSDLPF